MEKNNPQNMGSDLKAYARLQYKLIQLETIEKLSSVGSWLFSQTLLVGFLLSALLFLSTGGAFFLASLSGSVTIGFCLVGGFYILLFVIFYFIRQSVIKNPLKNKIIHSLLEEGEINTNES